MDRAELILCRSLEIWIGVMILVWLATAIDRVVRVIRWRDRNDLYTTSYEDVKNSWYKVPATFTDFDNDSNCAIVGFGWPVALVYYILRLIWFFSSRGFVNLVLLSRGK